MFVKVFCFETRRWKHSTTRPPARRDPTLSMLVHSALLSTPLLLLLGFLPCVVRADVPELPAIPQDKSTPLQQRLGYDSATSACFIIEIPSEPTYVSSTNLRYAHEMTPAVRSLCRNGRGLEYLPTVEETYCALRSHL